MVRRSDHTAAPGREKGVALITALLIVTMATLISASMLWTSALSVRRAQNILYGDQAFMYALGAEDWAKITLRQDRVDSEIDYRGEEWAVALPPLPIEGGYVEGLVEDMQGRFNINNLITADGATNPESLEQFQRLLQALEIEPGLAAVVADWIDADIEASFPDGAEDDTYTGIEPPYRTANTVLSSASELMAVSGIDLNIYLLLKPYVTALPRGTSINVNTASGPVLQSISEQLSSVQAQAIAEQTADSPFEDLSSFLDQASIQGAGVVDVSSNFFRATVRVGLGTSVFTMYSLLERDVQGNVWTRYRHFATE